MEETGAIRWRRDASTTPSIRVLWAVGIGSLLAAITLIVFARLFVLAAGSAGQSVAVAALGAVAVTVLALAASGDAGRHLERATRRLPVTAPEGVALERAVDAAVGAVAMGAVILALARGVGGNAGQGLATLTVPLGFCALVLAAYLSSTGTLDPDERVLYLFDPDREIDLETIDRVGVRTVGATALVSLTYDQSDGQYVPGPRRLVVPVEVGRRLAAVVN